MTWWMTPSVWQYEAQQVVSVYPNASWHETMESGLRTRVWRMTIAPVPDASHLRQVLFDLGNGHGITIGIRGRIGHSDADCYTAVDQHPSAFSHLSLSRQQYEVELTYPPYPNSGAGPVHPKARILFPEISARTHHDHPHLYVTKEGDSWACPLSPQSSDWSWKRGATLQYLDQLAIWLLKTLVWETTGRGLHGSGRWVGPDTPHDPGNVLAATAHDGPCWCGRGIDYQSCHLRADVGKLIHTRRRTG